MEDLSQDLKIQRIDGPYNKIRDKKGYLVQGHFVMTSFFLKEKQRGYTIQ
jgi:hypothetical protein